MTATINISTTKRGCLHKKRYHNRNRARACVKSMRRQGLQKPGEILCAYSCALCSCWHVGNRRES